MTDRDQLLAIFAKIKEVEPDQIDLSASLDSMDMDSIDVVEVLMNVEDQFQVYLSADMDFAKARTLGEILELLEQKIAESKNG